MRNAIGWAVFGFAIICGIYFGFWWAFIGGIVQVVGSIMSDPISASGIAFGIARTFFAGLIGWLTFLAGTAIALIISK